MAERRTVLGDRYVISDLLGRGGMAEVHRGLDQRLGRTVAVKQLNANLAADPTCQARFRREAQAAASLNHPAIAAVFDTGEETDPKTGISIPYIVMELVDGSTLRSMLLDGPPLEVGDALQITEAILQALSHSHQVGIIHRDIKPANVMLTEAGTVKVMDFGIARAIDDSTSTSLTQTATVIGTAQYLSPEQARGESVDVRSDIYSTGCVLYELLVGRTPFVGDSALSMAYQHVHEDPLPPSRVNPDVTPQMDAIVLRALAKDPDDRFPTAEAMATEIRRVLAGGEALPTTQVVAGPLPVPSPTGAMQSTTVLPPATALAPAGLVSDTQPRRAIPEPLPAPEEPDQRRRGGWVIVAALIALVLLASGLFWLFRSTPSNEVAVPDVVGSSRKEAKSAVEAAGFVAQFKNVRGDKATEDEVSRQNPAGGDTAPPGSTVTVELNVGPATAEIPDNLVGKDVEDAQASLKKAGFTNVTTRSADSDPADADPGEVLEVSPGEGSAAAPDEDVVLTVAGLTAATAEPAGPTSAPAPATTSAEPEATKTTKKPKPGPEETSTSSEESEDEDEEEPEASESAKESESASPSKSATAEASASAAAGAGKSTKTAKAEQSTAAPKAVADTTKPDPVDAAGKLPATTGRG